MNNQDERGPVQEGSPPIEVGAKIKSLPRAAAGPLAIFKSIKHGVEQAGVRRTTAIFSQINQKEGFDCQSCAWPSPDGQRHAFEFCENGVKAAASEASTKKIDASFFAKHSIADLLACSDHWHEMQGRLTEPVIRHKEATHYTPITWDDAFKLMGERLRNLPSPDEAVFYTSGRASNEAAFVYQLLARQLGTNNLPDCSNLCHESSGVALSESIGVGKGTVTLGDFEASELIVIIGQNPGTNHPRMMTTLEAAKKKGAKIIAINPLKEVGLLRVRNPNPEEYRNPLKYAAMLAGQSSGLADLFLQVRLNGDLPLFKALARVLLEHEQREPGAVLDRDFIQNHTHGFEDFAADIRNGDFASWLSLSGVDETTVRKAGEMLARSKRTIFCWAMGLTQHRNAVDTIRYVVNLALMGGHIGRPGSGLCPVRGHSNVQGDRTMGIWERPRPEFLSALRKEFDFEPRSLAGFDVVEAIHAMHEGRVKVFCALGGNFLQASPDTAGTAKALQCCEITVHVATKLNRSHLVTGQMALLLPCLGRSDEDWQASGLQFVTVEDSMSIVNSSRGKFRPVAKTLRSEVSIVTGIALQTFPSSHVKWQEMSDNYDVIRDSIARVVPDFEDFNARIRRGPFRLPNAARSRIFQTCSRKANFHAAVFNPVRLGFRQFLLQTVRSHDQFNTTIYGLDDRYRGIFAGRRVIFLNSSDIAEMGFSQGLLVDIHSHFDNETRIAPKFMVAPYDIPSGCAATYFPEGNCLVPLRSCAEKSRTPTSKSIVVTFAVSKDQKLSAAAR